MPTATDHLTDREILMAAGTTLLANHKLGMFATNYHLMEETKLEYGQQVENQLERVFLGTVQINPPPYPELRNVRRRRA